MDQYVVTVVRTTTEVWRVFAKDKEEAMENYTDGNNIIAQSLSRYTTPWIGKREN